FAGYANSLSDRVSFDTGFEYLQSVLVGRRFRLNWVSALTSQLSGRLGLSVTFTLRYEHEPLPNIAPLDTITAVLLTVRFIERAGATVDPCAGARPWARRGTGPIRARARTIQRGLRHDVPPAAAAGC